MNQINQMNQSTNSNTEDTMTVMNNLSPEDKKKLQGMVTEISNSLTRMEAERDFIKDVCNRAKDDLGVQPKHIRQWGKIHYKNSLHEDRLQSEELYEGYEQLFS